MIGYGGVTLDEPQGSSERPSPIFFDASPWGDGRRWALRRAAPTEGDAYLLGRDEERLRRRRVSDPLFQSRALRVRRISPLTGKRGSKEAGDGQMAETAIRPECTMKIPLVS